MSKNAVAIAKVIEPADAPALASDALALWQIDFARAPEAETRGALAVARRAVENGDVGALVAAIQRPAVPREISRMVGRLLGCWPKEAVDLSVKSETMATDLASLRPSILALESASVAVRRAATFQPSIAEVYAAVAEHQAAWEARAALLGRLPALIAQVDEALEGPRASTG